MVLQVYKGHDFVIPGKVITNSADNSVVIHLPAGGSTVASLQFSLPRTPSSAIASLQQVVPIYSVAGADLINTSAGALLRKTHTDAAAPGSTAVTITAATLSNTVNTVGQFYRDPLVVTTPSSDVDAATISVTYVLNLTLNGNAATASTVTLYGADVVYDDGVASSLDGITSAVQTVGYTYASADSGITQLLDASGGGFTIALPVVAAGYGFKAKVVVSSLGNAIVIDPNGGETLNGLGAGAAVTKTLANPVAGDFIELVGGVAGQWNIVGAKGIWT